MYKLKTCSACTFQGYTPDGNQYCENIHFVKEKLLGSGSFGKVDLMVDSTSRKKLVRKQVCNIFIREIQMQSNFNGSNIFETMEIC